MIPSTLKAGDKVAIISPAGNIEQKYIDGAVAVLQSWGLEPVVSQYACGEVGRYSGTAAQRAEDLQTAIDDKSIKAILCSRGGYGLIQIIDEIDFTEFEVHPKWLIGFSDVSILHAAASSIDVASIHSIMAKHLTELPADSEQVQSLKKILFGEMPNYTIPAHELNRKGKVHGQLVGGNLAVIFGLRGSHFDLDAYNQILFLEDVGEKPYQIDRMIQNLKISGTLENLSGLIVGQFSDYEEDPLMGKTVYELIAEAVADYDYPVCFNFPAGHVEYNLPLVLGTEVKLEVGDKVNIRY